MCKQRKRISESDSRPPRASGKLNAALKLRDKLAKILGIAPKAEDPRQSTTAGQPNFRENEFLFAGNQKPNHASSAQPGGSGTDKAEFEFGNKLRSLVRSGLGLGSLTFLTDDRLSVLHGRPTQKKWNTLPINTSSRAYAWAGERRQPAASAPACTAPTQSPTTRFRHGPS